MHYFKIMWKREHTLSDKKLWLFLLVTLECIVGFMCIYKYISKHWLRLSMVIPRVEPIRKEGIVYPRSNLRYYYEPKPDSQDSDGQPSWLPYKPIYTINADGLNDRYNYSLNKPVDTYRIIALGDSFTFGMWLNTADSWPELLEDRLNSEKPCALYSKYEVLNLGVKGYDIQYEVEWFRLHAIKYTPDMVVWLLHDNDFTEIEEQLRTYEHEIYDRIPQGEVTSDFDAWRIGLLSQFKAKVDSSF
jgi:hypothetical protein